MKYEASLFDPRPADQATYRPENLLSSARVFLGQLGGMAAQQLQHLAQLDLSEEADDPLETLYRQNHILMGMCRLYSVDKVFHLLEILDFALDVGRHERTVKVSSIDYLLKLFYDRVVQLAQEWTRDGVLQGDTTDMVEESRNYLKPVVIAWNQRSDQALEAFVSPPEPTQKSEAQAEPEAEGRAEVATLAPPIVIPFDDEPEPLAIPADKLGMISDFYEENNEILGNFSNQLIDLETADDPKETVNNLFRLIHTFKGGARLFNIKKMEALAHVMENLLDLIRQDKFPTSSAAVDLLLDAKGCLSEMMEETASRGPLRTRIRPSIEALRALIAGGPTVATGPTPTPVPLLNPVPPPPAAVPVSSPAKEEKERQRTAETLRVSSDKLDEVLNTASEIFIGRIRFQNEITALENFLKSFKSSLERASDLQLETIQTRLDLYSPEFTKELTRLWQAGRQNGRSFEAEFTAFLARVVGRLLPSSSESDMTLQEELNLNYLTIEEIQKQLQKNLETLEQLSTRLQNGAMSFRMVPIANMFERFPLQVRDLARTVGKKIKVEIVGGDTELDKVLITNMADPLMHMLRNSVDHGIELPEDRLKAGKPETGTIRLETYYHGSFAVIEIRDDGKGIDLDLVYRKALEKGMVPEIKRGKMSEKEILELIYLPGFSTKEVVTELSGRGVGMDVVKTAINQLHGSVEAESTLGVGTRFKLKLPLTLAIVKILLVQESSYQFALPILNIEALINVQKKDLNQVENRMIYNYLGQTIPVASLSKILDFPQSSFHSNRIPMVVLNEDNRMTGILVDSVLGRQEILIKNLGRFLKKVPFVMGSSILRDSRLVQILDPRQIVEAVRHSGGSQLSMKVEAADTEQGRHSVLVVDDSAIQRDNLRNILKNTQYRVETAENGFDALKASRATTFSAFCVDIVMPLMDGYEFVERLRKIPAYRDVPVFMITGKDVDQTRVAALGVAKVFHKPVAPEALTGILNETLKTGVPT